jgi:asparagine synthase (glutamine-hydrolysing)
MSAIAAIFHHDGQPLAGSKVERMLKTLAIYGPARQGLWNDREIALGHRLFVVVPEDRADQQPLSGRDELVHLVADARIDNRDELAPFLNLGRVGAMRPPDSHYIQAAYDRWGVECCNHLVGSFAFAIWDARQRQLFCGRDHLGDRPLFFHRARGFTAIASMPKGLFALPDIPRELDEETMSAALGLMRFDRTKSFFRDISCVPPGHTLTVFADRVSLRRYWSADQATPIHLRRDEDYVEAARALLDDAVTCRLRRTGRIATQLSGGLDSGAVAATAARLLAPTNEQLLAFTAVPRSGYAGNSRGRVVDEWPYAHAVARRYPNIEHLPVSNNNGHSILAGLDAAIFSHDRYVLNLCNWRWLQGIADAARARGAHVMLNGVFGNLGLSYDGLPLLVNSIAAGRWGTAIAEGTALARRGTMSPGAIVRSLLPPFLPAWVLGLRDRCRGRRGERAHFSALKVERLMAAQRAAQGAGWPSDMRQLRLNRAGRARALGRIDIAEYRLGILASHGIDERDPLMDKRLIEFCFAIPEEQFLQHGETRSLMRRVTEGMLPDTVRLETRRGLQAADWHETLNTSRDDVAAEIDRLEHSPLASQLLDLPRLKRLIREWPSGDWNRPDIVTNYRFALLRAVSAGRFIRSVEGGNA